MRIKHFFLLKEEHNQENWISFARYFLVTTLYKVHKDFLHMITDPPEINFYFEDNNHIH